MEEEEEKRIGLFGCSWVFGFRETKKKTTKKKLTKMEERENSEVVRACVPPFIMPFWLFFLPRCFDRLVLASLVAIYISLFW
jgi:hypothetical protein